AERQVMEVGLVPAGREGEAGERASTQTRHRENCETLLEHWILSPVCVCLPDCVTVVTAALGLGMRPPPSAHRTRPQASVGRPTATVGEASAAGALFFAPKDPALRVPARSG